MAQSLLFPRSDYHMHTPLCGHAVGQPDEYVRRALEVGLKEIGFSDHAPFVHCVDPSVTMSRAQLPEYYRMIEAVQQRFAGEIVIKMGLEADFLLGYKTQTSEIIADYPYDYVIGSVHFIKDWGFDDPSQRARWDQENINQVYKDYFELLRLSAQSGLFDIIGHADLVKKFGHRSTVDLSKEIEHNAEVFRACGVAVEINTAGLRKPVGEMYPAFDHLKIYARAGVPLTFGSDAHDPRDVGRDFESALSLAVAAGYKEYVTFKQRVVEHVWPLQ